MSQPSTAPACPASGTAALPAAGAAPAPEPPGAAGGGCRGGSGTASNCATQGGSSSGSDGQAGAPRPLPAPAAPGPAGVLEPAAPAVAPMTGSSTGGGRPGLAGSGPATGCSGGRAVAPSGSKAPPLQEATGCPSKPLRSSSTKSASKLDLTAFTSADWLGLGVLLALEEASPRSSAEMSPPSFSDCTLWVASRAGRTTSTQPAAACSAAPHSGTRAP
mmetsp:Transcript_135120/g.376444  ORF Transcript_135120/g.376444 Transcript_135120/m.376444 type:complete len:218 (-) Transcript_135120:322-975(-)